KETLGAFLTDWLENWVRPSVKPKTFSSYHDTVRLHLVPTLSRIRLAKLSPQHVQAMLNERLRSGLSARSVAYIRSVLGIALVRTEPKNNSSRRMLRVPAAALKALREHRVKQMEERLLAGEKWKDSGLVFTTTNGTPLDPRNVLRQFARVLEAAGIPHV